MAASDRYPTTIPAYAMRLRGALSFMMLFGLFSFFAFLLASGEWLGVAVLTGGLVGLALLSRGMYLFSLVWMLGMPTLFVFPDRYLNAIPGLNSGRIMFAVILGVFFMSRVFRLDPARRLSRTEFFSGLFLTIAFVSLLGESVGIPLSAIKENVALYLQGYLMPLGAYFIARRIDWSDARVRQFTLGLIFVGLFLSVVGVLQQKFGVTLFDPHHIEIKENRASGTLGGSHEFGAVLTALMIISLFAAVHGARTRAVTLFCLIIVALMAVALILTKTRGPWLSALVSIAFVFVLDRRVRPMLVSIAVPAVIAGAVLVPFLIDPNAFRQRLTEMSPIYNRLTAYATATEAIAEHPILGMGFSATAFDQAKESHMSGFGSIEAYWVTNVGVPHNEFLHVALLTGLPGLLIYLLIIWRVFQSLMRYRRDGPDALAGKFCIYVGAIVVSFVVNAAFVDLSLMYYFPLMTFFLAGMAIRYSEQQREHPGQAV